MSKTPENEKLKLMLLDEFAARRSRNASYSLRAFSRDLGINVTTLSEYFANRRGLSPRSTDRACDELRLSPLQRQKILDGIQTKVPTPAQQVDEDVFKLIADWYYYGILSLARLKNNRSRPEWIAKRLGIPVPMARGALERLKRLNLIKEVGGRLYRTGEKITTTNDVPSPVIRHYHKRNLEMAREALDREPFDRRFETAITMPTDPRKLKGASELITRFREELSDYLETGQTSEVYTLMIHLIPLTKGKACDR